MAIKSTIFKAHLQIADIDNGYYADHALTLARHPSENDERMMVRLLALARHAHALQAVCGGHGTLAFGAGLSDPNDPDVSLTDYTGRKRLWIEVGQPEEKPLSKACGKADAVVLYAFAHAAQVWWRGIAPKLTRLQRLQVWCLPAHSAPELAQLAQRSMQIQVSIQDGALSFCSNQGNVHIEPVRWM